jgi:hypothetical protein
VVYGLLVTALLTLFGIPNAPNQLAFALVVAEVSSNTLPPLPAWQNQFVICGIAGLVVFAIALLGLRELSPQLRDQLMVSMRDRVLIEARAKGIDVEASLRHPWRQMLHLDVIAPAFAISVFLLIYYTAVGFFTIYFTTNFGFSLSDANGLGNWFWALDAAGLIVVGIVSDWLKVRKPFMVVGALGAIVMTIVFLGKTSQPHTGYADFVLISLLAVSLAVAYAPWMASFTETVERRNPALTATGLAVWGLIIRRVVAASFLCLPFVVSSITPLVEYGSQVQTLATRYSSQLATLRARSHALRGCLRRRRCGGSRQRDRSPSPTWPSCRRTAPRSSGRRHRPLASGVSGGGSASAVRWPSCP